MQKNIPIQGEMSIKKENIQRSWYRFSRNPLSIIGLVGICVIIFIAAFAPYIAPSPESAGMYINFSEANKPPGLVHLCGTDEMGRDILSRVFFGFRLSLLMAIIVLSLVVPLGICMGLVAGYFKGSFISTIIMRITDIFLAIPALLLALVVCSILTPGVINAMAAVSIAWWPWYCRMVYGTVSSLKEEFFIQSAEVIGASKTHILFREILPNCLSPILTKMSLDAGVIILIGASISFVGLGAQPPTPDLGSMVAAGCKFLPDQWWISVFPAIAMMFIVLSFNLLGDGICEIFKTGRG